MWGSSRRGALLGPLVLTLSLLVPNVATVVGGFHGFYLTYLAWSALVAAALPLLLRGGRGALSIAGSAGLALVPVAVLTALGLLLGFDARRYPADPSSFLVTLGLFAVSTLGVEVGRSAAMSLTKRAPARVALGTLAGIMLGSTFSTLQRYLATVYGRPLTLLADLLYSLTISVVHELGGPGTGIALRAVVDGYWRLSPLVLTSSIPSSLRSAVVALTYYATLSLALAAARSLRGGSREVLELGWARKVLRVLPEALSVALAVSLLALAFGRFVPLVVTSGSMSPTLEVGDVVFVHATGGSSVGVGDVIAYALGGRQVVVHRVVALGQDWVRTKGDANPDPDPFVVDRGDILGKVVLAVPRVGYLAIALQTGGLSAYLPAALVSTGVLSAYLLRRRGRGGKLKFSLIK